MYRRRGERFADACVVERDRFGGGSVIVWGGIAHGIKSQLIIVAGNMTAVRYKDEILRPVAVPLVQQRNLILLSENFLFLVVKFSICLKRRVFVMDFSLIVTVLVLNDNHHECD